MSNQLRLQPDRIAANQIVSSQYKAIEPVPEADELPQSKRVMRLERIAAVPLKHLTETIRDKKGINEIDISTMTGIIRRLTQQVYLQGIDYVANQLNVEGFITQTDLSNIQNYSKQYLDTLLSRLYRFVLGRDPKLPAITHDFIVDVVLSTLTTNVLFDATLSKTQQLLTNDISLANPQPVITTSEVAAAEYTPMGYLKPPQDTIPPYGTPGYPGPVPQQRVLVWRTARDDRVCPYCRQFEMFMVPANEPQRMPRPHQDTHPHCRCRVVLTITVLKISEIKRSAQTRENITFTI